MFVFEKSEPTYSSEATGAELKFRRSSDEERFELYSHVSHERKENNRESLFVDYFFHQDDYYAAWLLESFSGVQLPNGVAHEVEKFDLRDKAEFIRKFKEADPKFSPWFESHCEPPEKKIGEAAASGEVVDAGDVPAVQGQ